MPMSVLSRLSHLRRNVLPGQADDADFLWRGRSGVFPPKLRGDDHAAELGEDVEDRGLGLVPIPRGERAGRLDVARVVARRRIPAEREAVHDEPERDRALDGLLQPVASLPDTTRLLRVLDSDLDRPAFRVAPDDLGGTRGEIGGDERDVVAALRAVPDEHDLHLLWSEHPIPKTAQHCDRDGRGLPVSRDGGLGEGRLLGEDGERGELRALLPGPAALSGPRRRELVERGVGAQPGGPGHRPRETPQRLARVCGVGDHVNRPVRERCDERLDEATGQREPGRVLAVLSDEREADRQRERPVEDRQSHHDRQDHPVVAVADLGLADSGAVVEPRRGMHLRSAAVEQRVVDRDENRRVGRHQQAHDEARKDRGDLLDRPAGVGEEAVCPVVAPGL